MEALRNLLIENQNTFTCNKTTIMNLIKQDLINWKMINLLQKIQIHADDYQLDIGSIIFEIMDLNNHEKIDEIFEKYVEMSRPVLRLIVGQSNRKIDVLAAKIYHYLEQYCQK